MHLACINLVEDLHEHKRVEHDGKVLGGWGSQWPEGAVIDVKEDRSSIHEDKHDRELVEGVAADEEPHVAGDEGARAAVRLTLEQLLRRGLGRKRQRGHRVHDEVDPEELDSAQGAVPDGEGSDDCQGDGDNVDL